MQPGGEAEREHMGPMRKFAERMHTATTWQRDRRTDEGSASGATAAIVLAVVVTGAVVIGSIVIALLIDAQDQLDRLVLPGIVMC
jgi:hypothetical protein